MDSEKKTRYNKLENNSSTLGRGKTLGRFETF